MEQALIQVGLPVKCAYGDCATKDCVKPGTNHAGWIRRSRSKWYCPEHAKTAKEIYDRIAETYKTPEPVVTTEEELYAILD